MVEFFLNSKELLKFIIDIEEFHNEKFGILIVPPSNNYEFYNLVILKDNIAPINRIILPTSNKITHGKAINLQLPKNINLSLNSFYHIICNNNSLIEFKKWN
jgi:hypothetical protein